MKYYQISEEDLEAMERELPDLSLKTDCNDEITRKQWEEMKSILSNVRWNYGPPIKTEER